jgi:hypothetical protein
MPAPKLSFDDDIKPLFRRKDRDSMRSAFDLWSYADVKTHADAIATRLKTGSMPSSRSRYSFTTRVVPLSRSRTTDKSASAPPAIPPTASTQHPHPPNASTHQPHPTRPKRPPITPNARTHTTSPTRMEPTPAHGQ